MAVSIGVSKVDRSASTAVALLSWESIALFVICTADMLTTLWWYEHGMAKESNPWLAFCLAKGAAWFCMAKCLNYVPVIVVAAHYRSQFPDLVAFTLRFVIVAYLSIYTVFVGVQFFGR
jgi:hypothetical protein